MSKKLIALTIVALIGLTMCSIALAKKPPKPPPPPPPDANPAIAYSPDGYIWVMDADGSNNTLVTQGTGAFSANPCWSPDGLKLAYNSKSPDYVWGVYTVNLDGTGEFLVTTHFLKEWSPDDVLGKGEKILVKSTGDLFLINPNGDGLVRLTNTPDISDGISASWSPDAKSIVAACCHADSSRPRWLSVYELAVDEESQEIYVASIRNIHAEAANYGDGVEYPTYLGSLEWANTQDKVVIRDNSVPEIWTLDLGPPYHMQQITGEGRAVVPAGGFVMNATWSPDDSRIAIAVNGSGRNKKHTGIYAVDAEDGANMEMLEDGPFRWVDWYRYAE